MDGETLDDILRAAVGAGDDEDVDLTAFCEAHGYPTRTLYRIRYRDGAPRLGSVTLLASILAPMLGQSVTQLARRIQAVDAVPRETAT